MKVNMNRIRKAQEVEFDENLVSLTFNTYLTKSQKDGGILAKVTINHPVFTTRATITQKDDGELMVFGSSKKIGENDYFNIVNFTRTFRDYVLEQYQAYMDGESEPWYMQMVDIERKVSVIDDIVNEDLDIVKVFYTALTDNQRNAGMVGKFNIQTSIGTVRGFTMFRSKFGNSVYGVAESEDSENKIPAYTLSREAEAQMLTFMHNSIEDWGEIPEPAEKEVALTKEEIRANIGKSVKSSKKTTTTKKTTKKKEVDPVEEGFEEVPKEKSKSGLFK